VSSAPLSLLAEFGAERRSRAFGCLWRISASPWRHGGKRHDAGFLTSPSQLPAANRHAALCGRRNSALLARYKLAEAPFERSEAGNSSLPCPVSVLKSIFVRHSLSNDSRIHAHGRFCDGNVFISFMPLEVSLATIAMISMLSDRDFWRAPQRAFRRLLQARNGCVHRYRGLATLLPIFVLAVLSKRIALVMALHSHSFFGIGVLHGLRPHSGRGELSNEFRYSVRYSYNLSGI